METSLFMVTKATSLEFPMMLRYNNSSSGYLEGGFVISKILGVKEITSQGSLDFSHLYNEKRNGLVFGLGGYLFGTEDIGISAGFRFRYDLTDAVNVDHEKYPISNVYATRYVNIFCVCYNAYAIKKT